MNLQKISSRIKGVVETQKITKAMQLVASAKLRSLRVNNSVSKRFFEVFDTAFQSLLFHNPSLSLDFLAKRDLNSPSTLFIIFFSNFGLCGNYNLFLAKHLFSSLKPEDKIVAFGSKSAQFLKEKFQQVVLSFNNLPDFLHSFTLDETVEKILAYTASDPSVSKISFVYAHFVNSLTFLPKIFTFFSNSYSAPTTFSDFTVEPESTTTFLASTFSHYFHAALNFFYTQSKLSEMSSRHNTMDTATNNAKDLIQELELAYNRKRQAKITQEISEIVAANLEAK